jgi:serine/threonine protein kinase
MTADRWRQVKNVFQAALERAPEARVPFLDEACGEDRELRREVESLLAARGEAGDFLSKPVLPAATEPDVVGRRIGPYRVLGRIGYGGMGVVYRAVRDDDVFHKTVALKIVHGGATPEHMRRLAQERQILARLQHPNIATILDGGTTDEGQPFLVMEYVEGAPIDTYCSIRSLGTRERLEIFRTVCGAVHYAHQNLVVHRDLKPQNILVTADGQPKLLDFGIAKLLAAGVDPDEAPTATLLPMMTPDYASPEQVRGQPVTTASDVYSLGVVLYELLTGRRPYTVRADSLDEIVRAVCDTEPELPSAAVRTGSVDATQSHALPSELTGDLDTIVLKALRKEPSRRYLSALELSDDVHRHLAGLPVLARKDTLRYRVGKFAGRHRTAVAGAGLVLVSLVGGIVTTARQARIAEANRIRAERRFADVRRLATSFLFEFHDAIKDLPGSTKARELVVRRALEYLDSLAGEAGSDRALQRDLADAYEKVGDVQGLPYVESLGDSEGALRTFERALDIRKALLSSQDDPAVQLEACRAGARVGRVLLRQGRASEALVSLRESIAWCEASWRERPGAEAAQERLLARLFLADALRRDGKLADAAQGYRGVLDLGQELVRTDPKLRRYLASTHDRLGQTLAQMGDREGSLKARRDFVGLAEDIVRDDPSVPRYRRNLGVAYENLANELADQGALKQALSEAGKAVATYRALHESDTANVQSATDLASGQALVGEILLALGEVPKSLPLFEEATRLAEEALAHDPAATQPRVIAARGLGGIGEVHGRRGESAAAATALKRAIAHRERVFAMDPHYEDNQAMLEKLSQDLERLRSTSSR